MRHSKEFQTIDGVADADDLVQVEVQDRPQGSMLYVHVNGQTVLRLGQIKKGGLSITTPVVSHQVYPDLARLRDGFSNAVSGLPNYRRTDAWSYIAALEAVIQRKDKEIGQLADSYDRGYRGGLADSKLRPGDGMMGG